MPYRRTVPAGLAWITQRPVASLTIKFVLDSGGRLRRGRCPSIHELPEPGENTSRRLSCSVLPVFAIPRELTQGLSTHVERTDFDTDLCFDCHNCLHGTQ